MVDVNWCQENAFCIWENSGYNGRAFQSGYSTPSLTDNMNNRMTSYWNRTRFWVCLYEYPNYVQRLDIPGFKGVAPYSSSSNVGFTANDHLSSFKFAFSDSDC
ncbi:peptidase inhibitor family I36 protein [Streptomyces sp. NBC_00568]|uniref:peptidase inhibitor family I36 protein n=1 Tax=Streptomyces sp. NBC_00568 TaxID=2975779 RepID=UPI0033901999